MSGSGPPPLPPRPPRPTEPFREAITPPSGSRPPALITRDEVLDALLSIRREMAGLSARLPEPAPPGAPSLPTPVPPSTRSRSAAVGAKSWQVTQWIGVLTLVLTAAGQVAAILKPGLVGPIQAALDALGKLTGP